MTVSFRPHPQLKASSVDLHDAVRTPEQLLRTAAPKQWALVKKLMDGAFIDTENYVKPCANGLVGAVIEAYTKHHVLVLRPDDVWLSIMVSEDFFP
jgi:hypothetical protein